MFRVFGNVCFLFSYYYPALALEFAASIMQELRAREQESQLRSKEQGPELICGSPIYVV